MPAAATPLYSHNKYWAECFGTAPQLPMSRAEMDALGWDSCDIIIVTGDAYVDHPSFGMAIVGRLLEAHGFRVGIIAQPDWHSKAAFEQLGRPNLYFGVAAGNMDSMINRYTADKKMRNDDAYTPGGVGGKRPDRCSLVYSQRCKEAYKDVPVVLGGIEASLRRIAHFDYWQDSVRRSILLDASADMLVYGNAERAIVELSHRIARGERVADITDVRGTAFMRNDTPDGCWEIDSTRIDRPGRIDQIVNPYVNTQESQACATTAGGGPVSDDKVLRFVPDARRNRARTVIRLPSFEKVRNDAVLYAHANRVLHLETNPGNARALVQAHGDRDLWLNPPALPLSTEEMDYVFGMPFTRVPHKSLWRRAHSGLRDDSLLGQYHARLLRRLHLLFDHRTRRPHHPESFRRIDPRGDRKNSRHGARFHRRHFGPGRADGEHVPARLQEPRDRSGVPAAELRVPRHLQQPEYRSLLADRRCIARRANCRA